MITALFSMVITLVFAYGLDYWHFLQLKALPQTVNPGQFLIGQLLASFILSVIWFGLGWLIVVQSYRNLALSAIFILIGILTFAWYPIKLIGPVLYAGITQYLFLFPTQPMNFQFSGLFIALLGCMSMFLPNEYKPA